MKRKADLEIICRYLQWCDPMKVIGDLVESGNLLNEYDGYAKEIHELLEMKAGFDKMLITLDDIQVNRMGLTSDQRNSDKDRILAEGLIACYENNEDLFY